MFDRTPSGLATALQQKPDLFHSAGLKNTMYFQLSEGMGIHSHR